MSILIAFYLCSLYHFFNIVSLKEIYKEMRLVGGTIYLILVIIFAPILLIIRYCQANGKYKIITIYIYYYRNGRYPKGEGWH